MATNRTGYFRLQQHKQTEKFPVMVSFIENSCMLWVQDMGNEAANAIVQMSEQLREFCVEAPKLEHPPSLNVIYATQFSEDNLWYRCVLRNNLANDRVRVHYIDYGNYETISANQLVALPDELTSIPKFAYKLWLHNAKLVEASRKEAIDVLRELTEGKILMMTRFNPLADSSGYYGFLYDTDNDVDIIQIMLSKGLMESREFKKPFGSQDNLVVKQKPLNTPGQQAVSPSNSESLSPHQGADKFPSPAPHEFIMRPNLLQQPPPHQQPPPVAGDEGRMEGRIEGRMEGIPGSQASVGQGVDTRAQTAGFKRQGVPGGVFKGPGGGGQGGQIGGQGGQIGGQGGQLEAIIAENLMLRSKLKSMQDEFNKLSTRTSNSSIHDRIQTTCKYADKVRKCRMQFPTDDADDLIEETINLLNEADAVNGHQPLPSLSAVSVKSDEYSQAQERILRTSDQELLSGLIEERNAKREEFCGALDVFLSDTSITKLEERDKKVKLASHNLDRQYHEFLLFIVQKQIAVAELSSIYTEWKSKQLLNFKILRHETSLSEAAICKALNQIIGNFTLSDTQNSGNPNLEFSFDTLLKNYASCLDRELNTTDIQQSPDSLFLATVIHNVKAACSREHANIHNVLLLTTEYSHKLVSLRRWLNDTPNMDQLTAARKLILTLRSRLRHLLADLQDLEENEDCDKEEKDKVNEELERVRGELHAHLVHEETRLSEVAQMASEHFPELYHTHPQLKLDLSVKYGNTVKGGRELDYYTLTPVPHRQGVYKSHFNNEPVYIKEYTIPDQHAFLSNVLTYQQLSCDYLAPLHAVFFSKSTRQAYTQTGLMGEALSDYTRSHKLTPLEQEKIVRQTVDCLQALHNAGFTYTRLSPAAIRWTGEAILLDEIDLSGQLHYPDWFMCNNLRFRPPEATLGEPVAKISDLYCLGLTILWLHFPDVTFPLKMDGSPDLNLLHMDGPIRKLLDILISRLQQTLPETLSRYYQYLSMCQKYELSKRGPSPVMPSHSPVTMQQRGASPGLDMAGVGRGQMLVGDVRDASSPASSVSVNTSEDGVSGMVSETESNHVLEREESVSPYDPCDAVKQSNQFNDTSPMVKLSNQFNDTSPMVKLSNQFNDMSPMVNHYVTAMGDATSEAMYVQIPPPHILTDSNSH